MNGVLAKPFTKEGMLKSIKTHLAHLLKDPPETTDASGFMIGTVPFMNAPGAIKFETSTPPSGAGNSGWSPQHMGQAGVDHYGMMNNGNQYNMGRSNYGPTDHDSPPEKRQRLNAGQANYG